MKNARHQQILRLIREYDIETQEELADRLNLAGFNVTQATVSRDIRQLQLQKVHTESGRQKYAQGTDGGVDLKDRFLRVFRDAYVSLDISGNIAVIRTITGMANAAGAAMDALDWPEMIGSIAGDDTLMIVLRSPEDAESFRQKMKKLTE